MNRKRVASLIFPRYSRLLDTLNHNARMVQWMRSNTGAPDFPSKLALYRFLNDEWLGNSEVDYLEFGVFEGRSMSRWLEINTNPASRFFGFDTFEGLPEDFFTYTRPHSKGHFSTGGETPDTGDTRVSFIKGLFQDTVDAFLADFEPVGKVVLHIDCDLYSSALFVLSRLDKIIAKGGLVLFDEFSSPLNEFRAFQDYLSAFRRQASVVAHVKNFSQVAVHIREPDRQST